jgi:hypothetical protein
LPRRRPRRRPQNAAPSAEEMEANVNNILSNMPMEEQFDIEKFDHEKYCVICLAEY